MTHGERYLQCVLLAHARQHSPQLVDGLLADALRQASPAVGAILGGSDNKEMQIRCSKCGEELMGSVNRCWRCGHRFVHTADKNTLPPIRRAPVVLDAPNREVVAVPIEAPRPEAEPAASSRAVRRYVESLVLQQRMLLPYAYASTVIGGIGCLTGWFTWWTIIPALVGVALGILGRNSTRNDIATTGIILCSIAIFASAVNAAYALFSIYYSRMLIDGFYDQQF